MARKTKGTPNEIDIYVGEKLRIRRQVLGVSQEELADRIGLTFQQIQKYERGINRISAGRLYEFSRVLSVPVKYFYDGCDGKPLEAFEGVSQETLQSSEATALLRAFFAIECEKKRKATLRFILGMKS